MPRRHNRYFPSGIHSLLGILPELSSIEVYVIHYTHLADVFSFGNQFG
jgi:hypothetical protein